MNKKDKKRYKILLVALGIILVIYLIGRAGFEPFKYDSGQSFPHTDILKAMKPEDKASWFTINQQSMFTIYGEK